MPSSLGLPAETLIDRYVTVGAYSLLRSCTIEPECIIGQHSILMEGSLVETRSILEAGSVVPPGRRIPSGELWGGNPARFIRTLTNEETVEIPKLAVAINHLSGDYFSEFLPYSTVYLESYSAEISPELAPPNRRPASSATEPTKPTESLVEGHHRIRDDETKPETPSAATADVSRATTRHRVFGAWISSAAAVRRSRRVRLPSVRRRDSAAVSSPDRRGRR
ncbi:unnamed protein product [Arabidopsis arenosa]|uniref:Uncharacterized protein n=1 Tax=Arabidopsis arenosa TaxID=38785 RepID=A0A8S2B945_ARAAE|nr:unnamed protein product [Arabidopsis arenosa]